MKNRKRRTTENAEAKERAQRRKVQFLTKFRGSPLMCAGLSVVGSDRVPGSDIEAKRTAWRLRRKAEARGEKIENQRSMPIPVTLQRPDCHQNSAGFLARANQEKFRLQVTRHTKDSGRAQSQVIQGFALHPRLRGWLRVPSWQSLILSNDVSRRRSQGETPIARLSWFTLSEGLLWTLGFPQIREEPKVRSCRWRFSVLSAFLCALCGPAVLSCHET